MTTSSAPVLLLGGTGRTGRRVAARLRDRSCPVRVASRRGEPPFAWDAPDGWPPLLDGVRSAYVAYAPDLALPEAEGHLRLLGVAARAAGLERLVLLSGRGEPGAARAEDALRSGGVPLAVARSSWFAQDFSEHFLRDGVLDGAVVLPTAGRPHVAEAFVDVDDVADVVAALLLAPRPSEETVELTGPELLTFDEAVAQVALATGRPLAYVPSDVDGFVDGAVAAGVPRAEAQPLAQLFAEVLDGRNEHLSEDLRRVLGRGPRPFADVVRRAVAAGAWDEQPAGAPC